MYPRRECRLIKGHPIFSFWTWISRQIAEQKELAHDKVRGLARLSGGTASFTIINTGGIELVQPGGMNHHGHLRRH